MADGHLDSSAGGIPLCVLKSGSGQHDTNGMAAKADVGNGSLIKERDYIGIGVTPYGSLKGPAMDVAVQVDRAKMDNGVVDLRLGLGPPDDRPQGANPLEQHGRASSNGELSDSQVKTKQVVVVAGGVPSEPSPQSFWQHSFRLNLSSDNKQQRSGTMAGCFTVPVPKVSSVPAKRPYVEAVGQKGGSMVHSTMSESAMVGAMVVSGMYAWNGAALKAPNAAVCGGAWQQMQRSYDHRANYVKSGGLPMIPATLQPPPQFKAPASLSAIKGPMPSDPSSSAAEVAEASIKNEIESEQNRCKAPVVGWPPVRAFRKNTLQATSDCVNSHDPLAKSMGGSNVSEQTKGSNDMNAFFVKAKLDGVRICRKVDLTAYHSYEGLKSALQDMFQGFMSGNAKLDLLHGSSHVVTHEDKDGDCLLVGDVPWDMFVTSSVKSLRIMKAMDAGDKGITKLKIQESGKL